MENPLLSQGVGGKSTTSILSTPKGSAWFAELQRLAVLERRHAFIPVGWGNESKAPMISGWQRHQGFAISQLMAVEGIRSVGCRTGLHPTPLVAFDFDGQTALELACSLGMEPWRADTWQVHRTTDPFRLKVLFSPTPEQITQLPNGEFEGKTTTKPAVLDADGKVIDKAEALEVFFSGGRQVIVIGEHPSSDGNYYWPDGMGPEALSAPPDAWWNHAIDIAKKCHHNKTTGTKPASTRTGTRRLDPCPCCGRNSSGGNGLWCEQTSEGLILCMPGSTFNADPTGSMALGTVVNGYALVKRTPISDGDCLTFAPHRPLRRNRRMPASYQLAQQRRSRHA